MVKPTLCCYKDLSCLFQCLVLRKHLLLVVLVLVFIIHLILSDKLMKISKDVSDILSTTLSHQDSTTSLKAKNLKDFLPFTCMFIKIVLLFAFWNTLSFEMLSCLCSIMHSEKCEDERVNIHKAHWADR